MCLCCALPRLLSYATRAEGRPGEGDVLLRFARKVERRRRTDRFMGLLRGGAHARPNPPPGIRQAKRPAAHIKNVWAIYHQDQVATTP
ncbi:unnamed protein product [Urochloa humidicola]